MRLVIDARLYGIEHRGIGRYTSSFLNALVKLESKHEFIILIDPRNKDRLSNLPSNWRLVPVRARVYTWFEQIAVAFVIFWLKADLVHFLHFNAPWFVPTKRIITVHDLIINHFPDSRASRLPKFLYKIKLASYFMLIRHNLKKATQILTVSKFVSSDIQNIYKMADSKIKPIYLADELSLVTPKPIVVPKNYFLYVGAAYPHKNLSLLIKAWYRFNKEQPDYKLLIVGKMDKFMQDVKNEFDNLVKGENLIFTNEVDDSTLVYLYKNCQAFVTASLMEGFGLGPLEAIKQSKLSILSDIPVFREVYDSYPLYFKSDDELDLYNKFKECLNLSEQQINDRLLEVKPEIKNNSWHNYATQVLSLYDFITKN